MADTISTKVTIDTKDASKQLKKLGDATESSSMQLKDLANVAGTGLKIGLAGAAAAITAFAAGLVKVTGVAGDFEKINTQFEVLVGNAEDAASAVEALADFSAKTPFQFDEIAKAGQQLLGFGFRSEDLTDKLTKIGDVAAASGTTISELGLIFGQVSAAGKLTGERLLQLQERAIPIGPAIAKTMGITEDAVRDAVSAGQVDFATFEKAFNSISDVGGQAFEGMAKQSRTLQGRISTLGDNFKLLQADIGKALLPAVKTIISGFTDFVRVLRENKDVLIELAVKGFNTLVKGIAGASRVALEATRAFFQLSEEISKAFNPDRFSKEANEIQKKINELTRDLIENRISYNRLEIESIQKQIAAKEKQLEIFKKNDQEETGSFRKKIDDINKLIGGIEDLKLNALIDEKELKSNVSKAKKKLEKDIKKDPLTLVTKLEVQKIAGIAAALGAGLKGGANAFVMSTIDIMSKSLNLLGPEVAAVAKPIIDVLGLAPEQFDAMFTKLATDLPILLTNIITNLGTLLSGKLVPQMIQNIIDNIPMIVESLTNVLVTNLSNPLFWIQIASSAASAFIKSIPAIVQGLIDGIKNGLGNIGNLTGIGGGSSGGGIFGGISDFIGGISPFSSRNVSPTSFSPKQATSQAVQEVRISFAENAFEIIESKLIERKRLGISTL